MRRPQTQALEAMWGLTYSKVKQMVGHSAPFYTGQPGYVS
jgi:hypothetical protein